MLSSQRVHTSRTRSVPSRRAHSKTNSERSYYFAKNSILTVIAVAMLVVLGFTIFNFIATPEFLVKREITNIATDYYENYFYNLIPNPNDLDFYNKHGFARMTLRQLLLYDDRKHGASEAYLSDYCDLDKTQIKIYPEQPYDRKSYHIDYTYSCKF